MVTGYTTVDYRKDSQDIIDSTQVNVSDDGYTSAVSSDALTNSDFMKLMLVEMQNQDPTNPMDTSAMMDNQLKMSQMESNLKMAESMTKLQGAFESSALAGAANMIGRVADMEVQVPKIDSVTGEIVYDEEGEIVTETEVKEYSIQSIIQQEGELFGKVNEIIGLQDNLYYEGVQISYTSAGFMYENGELTDYRVQLDENGRIVTSDNGKPIIMDQDGVQITDESYLSNFAVSGTEFIYGEEEILPLSSIVRIS
eukprot:Anaeramoba_ignava/a217730_353.p1 GENE.a217730_353~~a217730_353.p1  ORF type:complete len:254 (-),score=-14.72 a217730_353:112-873(-)